MNYKNANLILPERLVQEIQQYVQGESPVQGGGKSHRLGCRAVFVLFHSEYVY